MISGTISSHDYLQAHHLHRKATQLWAFAGGAVILLVGLALLLYGQMRISLIASCSGVGALVGEFFVANVVLPRKVKRLHGQQKELSSPFVYSWDRGHIEAKGVNGSSRRAWSDYCKVKDSEHIFLLYHADIIFEMLPKAWFKNESLVAEFREFANAATKSNAS
jgi:hypothetical protein